MGPVRLRGWLQRAARLGGQILFSYRPGAYSGDDGKPALGPALEAIYEQPRRAERLEEAGLREPAFESLISTD
uniref:Uncharacterized protein n=1 Tax=Tanacetum cinerariifolium TaxID=118510 RepID=A0A699USC6_TANCI|nr:hypothetical protein [Tanacetum cinerariifolium]